MQLTRRRLLGSTAILIGLSACSGFDIQKLAPTFVEYITNSANALSNTLGEITAIGGQLPAGWADFIGKATGYVGDISKIAGGINTSTLVSTATGDVVAIVHDFNAIVTSIITNPAIQALVAPTGFGWALSLAAIVLPLVEGAVSAVVAIVTPPAPKPVSASARLVHPKMAAAMPAVIDPATANEMLRALSGAH